MQKQKQKQIKLREMKLVCAFAEGYLLSMIMQSDFYRFGFIKECVVQFKYGIINM